MYFALEGIDTAGKSTQISALKTHLENAVFTKEPGATSIGSKIRDILLFEDVKSKIAEMLLFLADRAEHVDEVIVPNLDKTIISDRSVISGLAYAMAEEKFDIDKLIELNRFATSDNFPKTIIVLELSKKELEHRLSQKTHDKIEARGVDYLLNIQNNLIKATKLLGLNLVKIDASLEVEEITKTILETIKG